MWLHASVCVRVCATVHVCAWAPSTFSHTSAVGTATAEPLILMYETFLTTHDTGIKALAHIDSNHKLDPFTRRRASQISKVSRKHSIASLSARYMKENTVVSYNMPVFPFTANTLQRVPIEVGDVSPFPSLGVFWTFLRTNSPGGGRVIRNLAHLSALPDLSSLDPPHYTLSRASPTSVQETECEYVMQTSGQVLITMGKCLRTSLRDPLPPPPPGLASSGL